jgi:peptidoglycan/xylan/chitin deacetylase (PgdA/CDA1 family)
LPLTIVMYHYVRDTAATPYPGIKARSLAEFHGQLDHIERSYEVVGCAEVRHGSWPENAALLTFDDGLVDHAEHVLPELQRRGLRGCFCPPARAVLERKVLDVHKVQFVLAASPDHAAIAERIPHSAELRERYARPNRFDPAETVLVKRLLQDGLPEPERRRVLDELFADLVAGDETAFADELYMTLEAVQDLVAAGMDVAGHGYEHNRMELLDEAEQTTEIGRTLGFLALAGVDGSGWAMCYPYGSRNGTTLRLLREAGCALAFTVEPRVATPEDDPLELPRLDTNDLPLSAGDATGVQAPRGTGKTGA